MPQNFIASDREQALLVPPSLLNWLAPDHSVWKVLASVEEMDLSGVLCAYRPAGHGRPAYDPKVMVALVFYGSAQAGAFVAGDRAEVPRGCAVHGDHRSAGAGSLDDRGVPCWRTSCLQFRAICEAAGH
jgi:hypothetical protein